MKAVIAVLCLCAIGFSGSLLASENSDFRWKDLRKACKGTP